MNALTVALPLSILEESKGQKSRIVDDNDAAKPSIESQEADAIESVRRHS